MQTHGCQLAESTAAFREKRPSIDLLAVRHIYAEQFYSNVAKNSLKRFLNWFGDIFSRRYAMFCIIYTENKLYAYFG